MTPDQRPQAEPELRSGFYQPVTDVGIAYKKISGMVSLGTFTNEAVFEMIVDTFASIAHQRYVKGENNELGDPHMDWQQEDEVWIDRPGSVSDMIAYHQDSEGANFEREEEAWIQYDPTVYYFRRAVDGKVSTFKNTSVGDLNNEDEPHILEREQIVKIPQILLEELQKRLGE